MKSSVSYTIEDGIALVVLDAAEEKVNILTSTMLQEMEEIASLLEREAGVKAAVVYSDKKAGFIAGADIHAIEAVTDPTEATALAAEGQRVFDLWAALSFPVIAALHGHCMGGGTEFVLTCNYRIATPDTEIALPEVRLGLFPGFGGTQRLPRLIPLEKALDMILTGRSLRADKGLDIGLVDRLAETEQLRDAALQLAREVMHDPTPLHAARRLKQSGLRRWLLERNPLGRALLFHLVKKKTAKQSGGHYPAPLTALEVVRRGLSLPLSEGLRLEAKELGPVVTGSVCKNLIHLFNLSQRPKKHESATLAPLQRAAVLGAGVMGSGIATLLASKKVEVILKDLDADIAAKGVERVQTALRKKLEKRHASAEVIDAALARVKGTTEDVDLATSELVIEAVAEKMTVKQKVLSALEPVLAPNACFATNTSALSVSTLQTAARIPGRVGGLHFFNPVEKMPLVEVIRGSQSDAKTVEKLYAASLQLGKTPIIVADRPGFLVNRLLVAYLLEATRIAGEGVDWPSLDRLAKAFGLPMGPFRLIDEVGIDIGAEVGQTLCNAFSYLGRSPLMGEALDSGLLGRKGGKGFYHYSNGHSSSPNPDIQLLPSVKTGRQATDADLKRMLYLMVNEAARCLDEKVVESAADVDTGMVFGTGFPPFRGGLCRWADSIGFEAIVSDLEQLAARHGERFAPAAFLRQNRCFYP